MNVKILIASILLLTGCVNTKLVPQYVFPDAPATLMAPLPPLQTIKKPAPVAAPAESKDVTGS
jgi:hypothetical protein